MYIPLPSPAYECGWVSENHCVMVLQNGDIHWYEVDPFMPGPDFKNGTYKGGSLWSEGTDFDAEPTSLATSNLGIAMVAYDNWLFPLSQATIGHEVDVRTMVTSLAYSSTGSLAFGSIHGDVAILSSDASAMQKYFAKRHRTLISALAWSPDGRYLVTGDEEGYLHYCDAWNGEQIFAVRVSRNGILSLAVDNEAIIAVDYKQSSSKNKIEMSLYSFAIGRKKPNWKRKIDSSSAFAFAPSERLVGVGDDQGRIHLWKPDDPTFIPREMGEHQMLSPQGKVQAAFSLNCLAFSPSSRLLLSCAEDGFAHITPLFLGKRRSRDANDDEEF